MANSPDPGLINIAGINDFDDDITAAVNALLKEQENFEADGVSGEIFSFAESEIEAIGGGIDGIVDAIEAYIKNNPGVTISKSFYAVVHFMFNQILQMAKDADSVAGPLLIAQLPFITMTNLEILTDPDYQNNNKSFLKLVGTDTALIAQILLTSGRIVAIAALADVALPPLVAAGLAFALPLAFGVAAYEITKGLEHDIFRLNRF